MDKPRLTPPELRRKKAEKEAEGHRLYDEATADDKVLDDDTYAKIEGIAEECRRLDQQIVAAERWTVADDVAESRNDRRGLDGRPAPFDRMPHTDLGNTGNGRHGYSVMKALRAAANMEKLNGLELEVHEEMLKARVKLPRSASGVQIPLDLPIDATASLRYATKAGLSSRMLEQMCRTRIALTGGTDIGQEFRNINTRALDTTAGAGSIPTILDTTMIEILRARMVTWNLGSKTMMDMQGLFAIPRQSTASTFYMVGQGTAVTASNQTIDQVPFSPHTGGVNTQYTRQFLEQTNQDAEMFVREDQAAVVARGVETAAFNGSGQGGFPLGILNNLEIGVYSLGTNGAAPTWTQLVSQEAFVAYYNADVGSMAYVCDALIRGTLKLTTKVAASTFPIYLWNTEAPDFPVNGYPCAVTNLLPQNLTKGTGTSLHPMIFGNWEDLVYAFWSGMDVIVDPYTAASQGAVNLVTLQDFDVNVRHYQSFANCVDMISSITAPVT